MKSNWKLTDPDAPLRLASETVERYLRQLVEYLDTFNEDLGGTRPADMEAWAERDRHLAEWATEVYGAVTAGRHTYTEDDPR